MKKKIAIIILCMMAFTCLLAGCFGTSNNGGGNNDGNNGGNNGGEPEITYTNVSTVSDLQGLANQSGNYKLVNDIDVSGSQWSPIEGFSGLLEGDNYSIQGLTMSGNKENIGLFSTLKGTVRNLKVTSVNITGTGDAGTAGALCGTNEGTISNVSASGTINAPYYNNVGGVAGKSSSTITSSENNVEINGYDNVGGIVGLITGVSSTQFNSNKNSAAISGHSNVGGCLGSLNITNTGWSSWTITLSDNQNSGVVIGSDNNVGGIGGSVTGNRPSGYNHSISLSSNANSAVVNGQNNTGGIIGYGSYVTEITASTNSADVSGNNYTGGFVGNSSGTTIKIATNNNVITGKAYVGGIAGYIGRVENCTNNGEIKSTGVAIESSASCAYVGGIAGYATSAYGCTNNINILVTSSGQYVGGIVGYLSGSSSSSVDGCNNTGDITAYEKAGGILGALVVTNTGWSTWTIPVNDNSNSGVVNGTGNNVGGIIGYVAGNRPSGYNHSISFSSNTNTGIVSGQDYTGGIIGYGAYVTEITASSNSADITGNNYTGGYAGYATGASIKIATNNNTITGRAYVGGIAGYLGRAENCTNNGDIRSTGVIVESSTSCSYVGGIAGYATSVYRCTNNADIEVSTNGRYVAGIIGYINASSSTQIANNYNYASISGASYVGGITGAVVITNTGWSTWTVSVESNENSGAISATGEYSAGIVAYAKGNSPSGYNHKISFSGNVNSAAIDSSNYAGGIVGYGEYVDTTNAVWDSNTNNGSITGNNSGSLYGYLK